MTGHEAFWRLLELFAILAREGTNKLERYAHRRKLMRRYPYLKEAFLNITNVLDLFVLLLGNKVKMAGMKGKAGDDGKEKEDNKKVQKQKTL